jgi:alkylhydroperoxidase/carboxymuconolactone decarboxylase family protein YurZ
MKVLVAANDVRRGTKTAVRLMPGNESRTRMSTLPLPPDTYRTFVQRYPKIAEGWEAIASAGKEGPLGEKTARLIKLAVACGALREGAVHANVRKALAVGITREEIEQVIALTAGTLGLPATVAAFSWAEEVLGNSSKEKA